jgi:hypothetical protein
MVSSELPSGGLVQKMLSQVSKIWSKPRLFLGGHATGQRWSDRFPVFAACIADMPALSDRVTGRAL